MTFWILLYCVIGLHPATLFERHKITKEYQVLIKQMQNIINMFIRTFILVNLNINTPLT